LSAPTSGHESHYCIHGVRLRVATDSPAIAEAVEAHLRHFRCSAAGEAACLEAVLRAVPERSAVPVVVSAGARVLSEPGGTPGAELRSEGWTCTLVEDQGWTILDFHDQGLLRLDRLRRRMEVYLVAPEAMHPDVRSSLFHLGLSELLRAQELYTIHATALEKGGRAVLIPGASGRGKTTCCISLLRAGYRCLSDDHPLLRENGAGLEVLAFPEKIDVTGRSVRFFPELVEARERLARGVRKWQFFPEAFYPDAIAEGGKPVALLLPLIVDAAQSWLEPLPRSQALEEIMRQGLLVLDRERADRQFGTFVRLVETTPCYQLYFGTDVLELPGLIDPLLAGA
jgi:hypothetical protein